MSLEPFRKRSLGKNTFDFNAPAKGFGNNFREKFFRQS